jgi:hypothetical protein
MGTPELWDGGENLTQPRKQSMPYFTHLHSHLIIIQARLRSLETQIQGTQPSDQQAQGNEEHAQGGAVPPPVTPAPQRTPFGSNLPAVVP